MTSFRKVKIYEFFILFVIRIKSTVNWTLLKCHIHFQELKKKKKEKLKEKLFLIKLLFIDLIIEWGKINFFLFCSLWYEKNREKIEGKINGKLSEKKLIFSEIYFRNSHWEKNCRSKIGKKSRKNSKKKNQRKKNSKKKNSKFLEKRRKIEFSWKMTKTKQEIIGKFIFQIFSFEIGKIRIPVNSTQPLKVFYMFLNETVAPSTTDAFSFCRLFVEKLRIGKWLCNNRIFLFFSFSVSLFSRFSQCFRTSVAGINLIVGNLKVFGSKVSIFEFFKILNWFENRSINYENVRNSTNHKSNFQQLYKKFKVQPNQTLGFIHILRSAK